MSDKYTASIITVSDTAFQGIRKDISGKLIADILKKNKFDIVLQAVVPDDVQKITKTLLKSTDELKAQLVITTGGTGFAVRDNTPEATRTVIKREATGIAEAIRYFSLQITPRAMLSRGVAGIRDKSIIINLPGSPKAVEESLSYILQSIIHGIDILCGTDTDCARKE